MNRISNGISEKKIVDDYYKTILLMSQCFDEYKYIDINEIERLIENVNKSEAHRRSKK